MDPRGTTLHPRRLLVITLKDSAMIMDQTDTPAVEGMVMIILVLRGMCLRVTDVTTILPALPLQGCLLRRPALFGNSKIITVDVTIAARLALPVLLTVTLVRTTLTTNVILRIALLTAVLQARGTAMTGHLMTVVRLRLIDLGLLCIVQELPPVRLHRGGATDILLPGTIPLHLHLPWTTGVPFPLELVLGPHTVTNIRRLDRTTEGTIALVVAPSLLELLTGVTEMKVLSLLVVSARLLIGHHTAHPILAMATRLDLPWVRWLQCLDQQVGVIETVTMCLAPVKEVARHLAMLVELD